MENENKNPSEKRKMETSSESFEPSKKSKPNSNPNNQKLMVVDEKKDRSLVVSQGPVRTSSLEAPTMLLTGHEARVFCCKFSPSGKYVASGSFDKRIFLWNVYGDCENWCMFSDHKGAVLDLQWSSDGSDKTASVFDMEECVRIKRIKDHTSVVNSVCPTRRGDPLFATGSDDGKALVFDIRVKKPQSTFNLKFPVLSVCFSDNGLQLFTSGIDPDISCWDLRMGKILYRMSGHTDTVTSMEISPEGSHLLSNSQDNTLKMWDIKPFVKGDTRFVRQYVGHMHDLQKNLLKCGWSHDGHRVSAGSADSYVYVWNAYSTRIEYKLPGHRGTVNEVDFHPNEPILSSCADDKKIYLGEIKPNT